MFVSGVIHLQIGYFIQYFSMIYIPQHSALVLAKTRAVKGHCAHIWTKPEVGIPSPDTGAPPKVANKELETKTSLNNRLFAP